MGGSGFRHLSSEMGGWKDGKERDDSRSEVYSSVEEESERGKMKICSKASRAAKEHSQEEWKNEEEDSNENRIKSSAMK